MKENTLDFKTRLQEAALTIKVTAKLGALECAIDIIIGSITALVILCYQLHVGEGFYRSWCRYRHSTACDVRIFSCDLMRHLFICHMV